MTTPDKLIGKRVRVYLYDCYDRFLGMPDGRISAFATAEEYSRGARTDMVYVTGLLRDDRLGWKPGAEWFPVGTMEVIDP